MSRRPVGAIVGVLGALTMGAGACTLPQAEVCRAFVACQAAVDDSVDTSAWDEGGECWTLPDTARRCEASCRVALAALRDTPEPPPACTDDAPR